MPPTPDEIEAAAGRLRRHRAGEQSASVWPDPATAWAGDDLDTLADAWLAEHPADDGEAITADWLTASGLPQTLSPVPEYTRDRYAADFTSWRVTVVRRQFGNWQMFAWATEKLCDQSVSVIAHTRGQLRRLLAALGVPAANGGAPCPE